MCREFVGSRVVELLNWGGCCCIVREGVGVADTIL